MSSMKQTKEGVNSKKLLSLKNTGSIFVIAGLLMIFVIALYTFILQSSYTLRPPLKQKSHVTQRVQMQYTNL